MTEVQRIRGGGEGGDEGRGGITESMADIATPAVGASALIVLI
jgi:hypothetical protein